jgi:hypothetical protein
VNLTTDPVAAAVHYARAERHRRDAERFRKLRMPKGEAAALKAAAVEEDLAHMLSTGKRPRDSAIQSS